MTYWYSSSTTTASSSTWTTWTSNSRYNSSGNVWITWSNTETSTSTACGDTWVTWTQGYDTHLYQPKENFVDDSYRNYLKQQEEKRKQAEEAEVKAKELLLDLIGKDQMEVYERTGRLLVHGMSSDYLIQKEGYVKKIEKDKVIDLCIHLREKSTIPKTDNVVALALLATADEYEFERLANKHGSVNRELWTLPEVANFG